MTSLSPLRRKPAPSGSGRWPTSIRRSWRRRPARDRSSAWLSKSMNSSTLSVSCGGRPARDNGRGSLPLRPARLVLCRVRSSARDSARSSRRRRLAAEARLSSRHDREQVRCVFSAEAPGRNQRWHSEQRRRGGSAIGQRCARALMSRLFGRSVRKQNGRVHLLRWASRRRHSTQSSFTWQLQNLNDGTLQRLSPPVASAAARPAHHDVLGHAHLFADVGHQAKPFSVCPTLHSKRA